MKTSSTLSSPATSHDLEKTKSVCHRDDLQKTFFERAMKARRQAIENGIYFSAEEVLARLDEALAERTRHQ